MHCANAASQPVAVAYVGSGSGPERLNTSTKCPDTTRFAPYVPPHTSGARVCQFEKFRPFTFRCSRRAGTTADHRHTREVSNGVRGACHNAAHLEKVARNVLIKQVSEQSRPHKSDSQ